MSPAFPPWVTTATNAQVYDYDEDVPCPDCDMPIPLGVLACPGCGLTLAEVADRIAAGEAEWGPM